MSIKIGDLVEIKTHINSPVPGVKNQFNSPVTGSFIGSSYFAPEIQGKTGLVTSVAGSGDDDVMWVVPMVTVLLESKLSVILHEADLIKVCPSEKPGALSPRRRQ